MRPVVWRGYAISCRRVTRRRDAQFAVGENFRAQSAVAAASLPRGRDDLVHPMARPRFSVPSNSTPPRKMAAYERLRDEAVA